MAFYVGDQSIVGFYYESGLYANTSGALQWIGLNTQNEIDDNTGVFKVRAIGGGTRNVTQYVDGPLDHTGTLTFYPQDWKFLGFALGSIVDGGSPTPYTHTLKEFNSSDINPTTSGVTNPFISFAVEDSKVITTGNNAVRTIKGCMVNSFTLNATAREIMECEVEYVGQNQTFSSGASSSITAATTTPFVFNHGLVSIPSGTANVYGEITELSVSLQNNLLPNHYVNGSRVIFQPIPQNRDYEVTATLHATNTRFKTLYEQYFLGGSTFNMQMYLNAGPGTGSNDALWTFSGCKLMDMESPTTGEGVQEMSVTISPTSSDVLVNDAIFRYLPW